MVLKGFVTVSPCLSQPQAATCAFSPSEPTIHTPGCLAAAPCKMKAANGFLPNLGNRVGSACRRQGQPCLSPSPGVVRLYDQPTTF